MRILHFLRYRPPAGILVKKGHCLTLILACVIYWQAKELDQLVNSVEFKEMGFDPELIQHISSVDWDNVVLYGEYIIDKALIYR